MATVRCFLASTTKNWNSDPKKRRLSSGSKSFKVTNVSLHTRQTPLFLFFISDWAPGSQYLLESSQLSCSCFSPEVHHSRSEAPGKVALFLKLCSAQFFSLISWTAEFISWNSPKDFLQVNGCNDTRRTWPKSSRFVRPKPKGSVT